MSQKQNRKAQLLTGVLIAAIAAFLVAKQRGLTPELMSEAVTDAVTDSRAEKSPPSPQDAVYAMFDAAREGNVPLYLTHFTGRMTALLNQSLAENGEAKFAEYLKRTNAPIKGVAINEPQKLTEREVKARVEYVYADRNEVQNMFLVKIGEVWKIERLEETERIKTLIPYGTSVR